MAHITIKEGKEILAKFKYKYTKWVKKQDKAGISGWNEFVSDLVKSNNYNNGFEDDLIFNAEDAINNLS